MSSFSDNSFLGFFKNIPTVTRHLLIINVLFWLACIAFKEKGVDLIESYSLHYWGSSVFHPIQFITYMFLHAPFPQIWHIFFNMFSLFMFGRVLEMYWGPKFYFFFYIVTGLFAGLAQELTWMYSLRPLFDLANEPVPFVLNGTLFYDTQDAFVYLYGCDFDTILCKYQTLGASGAIFGLLAAFAMKFPNHPIYLYFVPIPIKAKYAMIGIAVLELYLGVSSSGDGIAHYAHLGGALGGILLVLCWNKFYIPNR